jgi:hypothetical protein
VTTVRCRQGDAAFEPARAVTAVELLASLFVPIPDAGRRDWWNSVLTGRWCPSTRLGEASLSSAGLRRAAIFAAWIAAAASIMLVAYQGGFASMRHGGYAVVLLIAALWIARASDETIFDDGRRRVALLLFFALGAVGAATAWIEELSTPFSAVEQLPDGCATGSTVCRRGSDSRSRACVASRLDWIYYPQRGEWGFVSWDPKRRRHGLCGDATSPRASGRASLCLRPHAPADAKGPQGAVVIREAMIAWCGARLAAFTDSVSRTRRCSSRGRTLAPLTAQVAAPSLPRSSPRQTPDHRAKADDPIQTL